MINRNRVKFYSASDLSLGTFLGRIEDVLNSAIIPQNLNDIIELYNIQKFINNKIYSKNWDSTKIDNYQHQISQFKVIIPQWIANHKNTLTECVSNIYPEYKVDFWEVIGIYNISKDWSDSYFKVLSASFSLYHILLCKSIVNQFALSIIDRFKKDEDALELILSHYVFMEHFSPKFFLPSNLDIYTIELIMNKYLEEDNASIRNLEGIMSFPQINGKKINKKTKILAKQKYHLIREKLFKQNNPQIVEYSLGVSFSPEVEEKAGYIIKNENKEVFISYSSDWIINNKDYPTLLNNFIYLFGFVDTIQMRFMLYNNNRNHSLIDFLSGQGLKGGFNPNFTFNQNFNIKILQVSAYYHFMKKVIGISIENLIEYFFSEYLPKEFSINGFQIHMPTKNTTYLEKCKIIAPELEILMRMYHHYASEGIENGSFLEFDSDIIPINLISSLIPHKYVYPEDKLFDVASHYLCSNQSMLSYLQSEDKSYNSFIELLLKEKSVSLKDYNPIHIQEIQWLNNNGFVKITEEQKILLEKPSFIIYDLFENGYISWWHTGSSTQQILKNLELKGFVKIPKERRLFSEQECDVYNYILNNHFTDSLAIRNKYSHGNINRTTPNSKEHHDNYMLFLLLLINFIIKINDELCIVSSRQIDMS
ncbi:MAG: hypothetical protein M0R38_11035 [Bacteroidia bacterium]|nr:hypothetical protein [Bacteroidia bacterium]